MYIIKILNSKQDFWIAKGNRIRLFLLTKKIEKAQRFENEALANKRIEEIVKTFPFKTKIYKVRSLQIEPKTT